MGWDGDAVGESEDDVCSGVNSKARWGKRDGVVGDFCDGCGKCGEGCLNLAGGD